MGNVYIATSGWSYKHWYDIFYPQDLKPINFLEHYVNYFSCTELNSSFYHLPKIQTVKNWYTRTPDNFFFAVKMSRLITHYKKLLNTGESIFHFHQTFTELKDKIGPVLIQFPPGLQYNPETAASFFNLLKIYGPDFRYAVEVRNRAWLTAEFYHLLQEHNIALVISHSNGRFPYIEQITANFVYIRFHGPEGLYSSGYNDDFLYEYAHKIKSWSESGMDVWAFFNNDFGGYAVKNALSLKEII